uniref:SMC_N domain-containing protein n=1 Tax=Caenorhabditis tropicalis TaxID=1561998 RepID=A0A1I7UF35_9PELO
MSIKYLQVRNFKCFDYVDFRGFEEFSGLLSRNNVGKTALMQAIVFVIGGLRKDFGGEDLLGLIRVKFTSVQRECTVTLKWETDEGKVVTFMRRLRKPFVVDFDPQETDDESGSEEKEEEEDLEDQQLIRKEDQTDYYLDSRKVSRRLYMAEIRKLKLHFNGEQAAVLDLTTVPVNNKMISSIFEKFSGSSRHGRQMRSIQVEIDAGEEQMKKLTKIKEDIEKEKKKSKEFYLLKCFHLDQMISEKDKLVKNRRKLEFRHPPRIVQSYPEFRTVAEQENQARLLEPIPKEWGDYEIKKKLRELKEGLPGIQLESFSKDKDIPTIIEKELACEGLLQDARKYLVDKRKELQEEADLRKQAFNSLFIPVARMSNEIFPEMWGVQNGEGIQVFTKDEERPWSGIRVELKERSRMAPFGTCSTGQRRMVYTAIVFSILQKTKSPIVFLDGIDKNLLDRNVISLIKYLKKERREDQTMLFAVSAAQIRGFLNENEIKIEELEVED